jgi:glycosyltransferase involved in cell wall biosynthesis
MRSDYCVVIPAFNAEQFVASSIASVRNQTIRPLEIVVVDDGSGDRTAAVASDAGATVISQLETAGPSASRNLGVANTSAPVIAFLDADDEWKPDHAERLLSALLEHDAVFAAGAAEKFGSESGVMKASLRSGSPLDLRDALILDNPVIQSAAVLRRSAFVAAGGYDESMRMSEDYDLWARIADTGSFAYVDVPTVRRRMHDGQATHRIERNLMHAAWAVRRRSVTRRLLDAGASERERVFRLLEGAAARDVERAIWSGDTSVLGALRSELRQTDEHFGLRQRFSAIAGLGEPARRVLQDIRCWRRSLLQALRGQRWPAA